MRLMLITFIHQQPYLILFLTAFFVNIPLGFIRERCPKFSFSWLFWIHASIPFIIYLRVTCGISKIFIPLSIFCAVIGQIVGSRWRRKIMSRQEAEQIKGIPDLNIHNQQRVQESEVMVALLNMGGPKSNDDVRNFQKRLFSDRKLIRFPLGFLLQGIFMRILLALRVSVAKARYQLIGGGSPIFHSTEKQVEALKEKLKKRGRDLGVTFSFNYSDPLPEQTIQEVKEAGKKFILPLSLYPQYSSVTTGSNLYHLKKAAKKIYPELQFLDTPSYFLHEGYIQAFVERIQEQLHNGESLDDFYIVFTAHNLPLYSLKEGDPYPFQIAQTVAKILDRLNRDGNWVTAYQSAVGPLQWMKPSTKDTIKALADRGIKKVLVVPVSFVSDHIETLWEINIQCCQLAQSLGIIDFRMSKAIECHPGFIKALADSVEDTCQFLPNTMSLSL